uniref:Uncharacterized protein n=1 Tax=Hordeum vulgare subsp. vulgare TaxID=112509 RepID=A0A8I6WJ52_HORVV
MPYLGKSCGLSSTLYAVNQHMAWKWHIYKVYHLALLFHLPRTMPGKEIGYHVFNPWRRVPLDMGSCDLGMV